MVQGKLGPGQLGPGQLGPRAQLSRAQFATFSGRIVGPRGLTVRGPICHFFRADSWTLGPNCPGPSCLGPNCPGPNLPRTPEDRPVAFKSRSLKPAENGCSKVEGEILGVPSGWTERKQYRCAAASLKWWKIIKSLVPLKSLSLHPQATDFHQISQIQGLVKGIQSENAVSCLKKR